MNNSRQETSADVQETEFGGYAVSKQRKIIHFSSGETLEEEGSEEEEEQPSDSPSFREPAKRTRFSLKTVAILVGKISLLTCDFLGETLAGILGLNAAKYQYAIDQYHREHKTMGSIATDSQREGQAESTHLSPGPGRSCYGTSGDRRCSVDNKEGCDENHTERNEGCHNKGYQADELE